MEKLKKPLLIFSAIALVAGVVYMQREAIADLAYVVKHLPFLVHWLST